MSEKIYYLKIDKQLVEASADLYTDRYPLAEISFKNCHLQSGADILFNTIQKDEKFLQFFSVKTGSGKDMTVQQFLEKIEDYKIIH